MRTPLLAALLVLLLLPAAAGAATPTLRAGAGKADITPKLGYALGGWVRADRTGNGQHTRLHARALVLKRGDRKIALVSVDLFMIPGGMVKHIGDLLADRGLSEQTILVSASHTHSGPAGFGNYPSLNTIAPSTETISDPLTFVNFFNSPPADPQLYAFLTEQIATAIRRADDDLAPAAAGWGSERILGLTRNRSVEAHLHNHGITRAYGQGRPEEDPEGAIHTIDPDVNVLRVDHVRGSKRVPIGAWSTFADHGTVTKSSFEFYNGDHNASAMRVFEQRVRAAAKVPASQEVVNVYGNSNEGDMSAGLDHSGPAGSDYVGRIEASAMFRAWKRARLSRRPALDSRWTRMCFCGQQTESGQVADQSQVGLPFLTGSEEGRGPLFDVTGQHYEDTRNEAGTGPHGKKYAVPAGDLPKQVPLLAVRVGPRAIVTIPGEGTKEVGARVRAAATAAVAGSGIEGIVISGLANEFVLYFTTPEEYDRQHYEGGNTQFGRSSSTLLRDEVARLTGTLARGEPAPPLPGDFDPTNGVTPEGPPYPDGAESATILEQPVSVPRLERAHMRWQGGPEGLDRPVDEAFVTAQRLVKKKWVRFDDDLGLAMLWKVAGDGVHDLQWEVPRDAPAGQYRLVVTAKRYRLESTQFTVTPSRRLTMVQDGRAVRLRYPVALENLDLTYRPATAPISRVRAGQRVVKGKGRRTVQLPAGVTATSAADRWGNSGAR
jgi:hypothetical protein